MRRLLLLLGTVALVACGGSDSTSPTAIAGTYTLQTVAGSSLPATIAQSGADKLEVTAGTATLNSDHTFSGSITSRSTVGGSVTTETDPLAGTWSQSGSALTFNFSDQTSDSGSISGNTLTIVDGGVALVFTR